MSQQQPGPWLPPEARPAARQDAPHWYIPPAAPESSPPSVPLDPDLPAYAPIASPALPAPDFAPGPVPPGWSPPSPPPWRDPFFYGTADRPLPPPWRVGAPPAPSPDELARADVMRTLRQPLTGPTIAGCVVVGLVLPCIAVVVGLSLTLNDWASGALVASASALLEGVLLLAFAVVRRWIGYASVRALVVGVLVALALIAPGLAGLQLAASLHLTQAQVAEAHGDWVAAVREYEYAGREPPTSQDLARIYNEWGEQYLREGYANFAAGEFNTVLTLYPQSGSQFTRALSQVPSTYAIWIAHADSDVALSEIVANLDGYYQATWCVADCATTMRDLVAQARYTYGTRLAAEQQYQPAIAQFAAIASKLTGSDYVARAHEGAAAAYLAVGQGQRASDRCHDAISTYQTLATSYGDTPQGKGAKADLSAPVVVTGVVAYYSPDQPLTMWLSRQVSPDYSFFSHDLSTSVNSNGLFVFKQVPPGQYALTATGLATGLATGEAYFEGASMTGGDGDHNLSVQPLCQVSVGTGYLY